MATEEKPIGHVMVAKDATVDEVLAFTSADWPDFFDSLAITESLWRELEAAGITNDRLIDVPHEGLIDRFEEAWFTPGHHDELIDFIGREIADASPSTKAWLSGLLELAIRARERGVSVFLVVF